MSMQSDVERVRRGAQTICESREGECPRSRTVVEFFFLLPDFPPLLFSPLLPPPPDHLNTQTHWHSIDPVSLLLFDQLGQTPGMRLQVQLSNIYTLRGTVVQSLRERCNLRSVTLPSPHNKKTKQLTQIDGGKPLQFLAPPHLAPYLTTSFPRPYVGTTLLPSFMNTPSPPPASSSSGTVDTKISDSAARAPQGAPPHPEEHISGAQGGSSFFFLFFFPLPFMFCSFRPVWLFQGCCLFCSAGRGRKRPLLIVDLFYHEGSRYGGSKCTPYGVVVG